MSLTDNLAAAFTRVAAEFNAIRQTLAGKVDTTDPRLSDARTPTAHTHPAAQISDATATGRAVVTAADAAAARAAIGAGTGNSNLALGTTASTALAGNTTAAQIGGVSAERAGAALWYGTQAEYDALPAATKNAAGFVAVIS